MNKKNTEPTDMFTWWAEKFINALYSLDERSKAYSKLLEEWLSLADTSEDIIQTVEKGNRLMELTVEINSISSQIFRLLNDPKRNDANITH